MTSRKISEEFAGGRLDKTVKELFGVTWSKARTWIENGKISIGGRVTTDLAETVCTGDALLFTEDAAKVRPANAFHSDDVVYMDTHLLVAYKPSGIMTIPFEKGDKGTFDQQVRGYLAKKFPRDKKRKGALPALMVVHRLDKGTSGLIVFARTWAAKEGLAKQFRDHSITRSYLALVHGHAKSQTIKSHLMQDRGDGIRGSSESSPHGGVRRSQKGQLAITHVSVEQKMDGYSKVRCRLETGRTNQIRIHLSEEGNPLIGETTYMRSYRGDRIEAKRLMLHAEELGFVHPVTEQKMHFTQPTPDDFGVFSTNS